MSKLLFRTTRPPIEKRFLIRTHSRPPKKGLPWFASTTKSSIYVSFRLTVHVHCRPIGAAKEEVFFPSVAHKTHLQKGLCLVIIVQCFIYANETTTTTTKFDGTNKLLIPIPLPTACVSSPPFVSEELLKIKITRRSHRADTHALRDKGGESSSRSINKSL